MEVLTTRPFDADYHALPEHIQALTRRKLKVFAENPRHPSLRTKKMAGQRDIWEARVTSSYRFTFQWAGNTVLLRRIGTHDILKRP